MYFSRISVDRNAFVAEQVARDVCLDDAYKEHQLLWQMFENESNQNRDFIFRREQVDGFPRYYVVSEREPKSSFTYWRIEHKPYSPKLIDGQNLGFRLRVNPVITRSQDNSGQAKSVIKRHDVVMDLKKQVKSTTSESPDDASLLKSELIEQAGVEWLSRRLDRLGFNIEPSTLKVDGYTQHRVYKHKSSKPIRYSTLDYEGVLQVTDASLFLKSLFKGIGPAKSFGCGLLLVRPI